MVRELLNVEWDGVKFIAKEIIEGGINLLSDHIK